MSGADGRGGRKTVYRPGAAASMSSMSSWGEEDELSSSRFAKKRPKLDAGAGAAGVSQKVRRASRLVTHRISHTCGSELVRFEFRVASLRPREDTQSGECL